MRPFNLSRALSMLAVVLSTNFVASESLAAPLPSTSFQAKPLASTIGSGKPLVMLALSKDHQLFYKAYTDYTNLDDDPAVETTYKNSVNYAGYFDSDSCYKYVSGNSRFERVRAATSHYCNVEGTGGDKTADADRAWSGNFLNWASMTRMDLVRAALYGGLRSTDTATVSVLERAHLPNDAHSFAKYYNGADLTQLVPYQVGSTNGAAGRLRLEAQNVDDKNAGLTLCNTTLVDPNNLTRLSQNETNPPVIRAAKGNYTFWAAGERFQCLGKADGYSYNGDNVQLNDPARPASQDNQLVYWNTGSNVKPGIAMNTDAMSNFDGKIWGTPPNMFNFLVDIGVLAATWRRNDESYSLMEDMVARVLVCAAGEAAERCKAYGANKKPEGLLQQYGMADDSYFGLMTGSYAKNKTGGVLRKHIGSITTEVNTTDGTFKSVADVAGGSIIKFLDTLRVLNWSHDPGSDVRANGNDSSLIGSYISKFNNNCGSVGNPKLSTFVDGSCVSWGNPFGEVLAESYRYFTGATAATAANVDATVEASFFADTDVKTLNTPKTWGLNPLREITNPAGSQTADEKKAVDIAQACAPMTVIGFNSSTLTYDDVASVTLPIGVGAADQTIDVKKVTNSIGQLEGLETKNYYMGNNGVNNVGNVGQCTAKTLGLLGNVTGICLEAPRLEGSYGMAGLAYYARTNDMNKRNRFPETDNYVRTLGVALAPGLPTIDVMADGAVKARIVPSCRNDSVGGNCAVVDFKRISYTANSAVYAIVWEDTEQGSDYDQDLLATISYSLTGSTLTVTSKLVQNSTGNRIALGYVITGTTTDGLVWASKNQEPDNCGGCSGQGSPKQNTYTISGANVAANTLPSPLYFAAKWGGYIDEADVVSPVGGDYASIVKAPLKRLDSAGQELVDSYIKVDKPQDLKTSLGKKFDDSAKSKTVLSGGSSVALAGDGAGLALQSYYLPSQSYDGATGKQTVTWLGALNGLFVDDLGRLREDSEANGVLSASDDIVVFKQLGNKTVFDRFNFTTGARTAADVDLADLKPIWSARDELAKVTAPTVQRTYATVDSTKRHILTGFHGTPFTNIKATKPFAYPATGGQLGSNYTKLLDTEEAALPHENVVNYIRGQEFTGLRSRTLPFKAGETAKSWLLGDIVGSRPLAVQGALANYSDSTYKAFRSAVASRRQVVYVGANDGLLHAFNAGFYNPSSRTYSTAGGAAAHALGAELWAYAPYNLLPQYKFLTNPSYDHVFYVNGALQAFDVKIFANDADHPGGWGTILVGAMGLGGGDYPIDLSGDATPEVTTRSAIMVFDITNPEAAPKLLTEMTDDKFGYTTTNFAVSRTSAGVWKLHFGSGPTDKAYKSAQNPYLFSLNLSDLTLASTDVAATGEGFGFVGNLTAQDWNDDGTTDTLYFGTLARNATSSVSGAGSLKRAVLGTTTSISNMLSGANKEFWASPLAATAADGSAWVYAGAGAYLATQDRTTTQTNSYYGLKESFNTDGSIDTTAKAATSLKDVTAVKSLTTGGVLDNGTTVTRKAFAATVKTAGGWKLDFASNHRNYNPTYVYGMQYLLFDTYKPNNSCSSVGESNLYLREFDTGLVPAAQKNTAVITGTTLVEALDPGKVADEEIKGINTSGKDGKAHLGLGDATDDDVEILPLGTPSARSSWKEAIGYGE